MNPTISVIIPVYNGAKFLRPALESVFAQSLLPTEVLVVDDGSTDESPEIARSFSGVTWIGQENRGPAAARNLGVARSQGDYLAFVDQDDIWLPEKLELQLNFLLKHKQQLYCLCLQRHVLEVGSTRPEWLPERAFSEDLEALTPSALFARREAFDAVGLFDETINTASDADWFFRAEDKGFSRALVNTRLIVKRVHNECQSFDPLCREELLASVRRSIGRKRNLSNAKGGSSNVDV